MCIRDRSTLPCIVEANAMNIPVVGFTSSSSNGLDYPIVVNNKSVDFSAYALNLLDTINNNYPIDTNKVYASGHSMGGAMTNHLACTSTRFTALGSSGGWMNFNYMSDDSEYYDVCNPITVGYTIPTTHTHGLSDETVPNQFGQMAAIMLALKNGCDDPFSVNIDDFDLPTMDTFMDMDPSELDAIIDDYLSTADTLYHTGAIHRYQWSKLYRQYQGV